MLPRINRPPYFWLFSIEAQAPQLCPYEAECEVPNGALLFNGQVGDYRPPLYLDAAAIDPDGDLVSITWYCKTGNQFAAIEGFYRCNPIYSATEPITVYAVATAGAHQVTSEVRTYTMLQRTN